ncbi:hypothetical protein M569_15748 [Genlisea aurea]|uniref:Peptidase C14 caspase domain-containing protein n=1 Tax=Genlisea aurea TaxID=192259 RepID=S8DI22_9LAMI|nr:hypothetical protein M569_15748 [Genlisea aurea]
MAKKAVLIGCNYPGTQVELKGCVNDVWRMHRCLVELFGFHAEDITVLVDTDRSYAQPTGRNIRRALVDLVRSASRGDVLFVHYSGHGTRLPAEAGEEDDTGFDECIVPTDMNLITDDDFREVVDELPPGCSITIVSDSCHSGGLIHEEKEQIGVSKTDSMFKHSMESRGILLHHHHRNKSLPLPVLIQLLKQKTGKDDIAVGQLRPALFDLFGEDSSPKVKKFMNLIFNKLQGNNNNNDDDDFMGALGGLALQFLRQKLEDDDHRRHSYFIKPAVDAGPAAKHEAYAGSRRKSSGPDGGILVSGCQSDETSADANPTTGDPRGAYGAMSNAVEGIIWGSDGRITNRELVLRAREVLRGQGFSQRPGLYCSDDHVDAPFICWLPPRR